MLPPTLPEKRLSGANIFFIRKRNSSRTFRGSIPSKDLTSPLDQQKQRIRAFMLQPHKSFWKPGRLPLSLFVFWIFTNNSDAAFSLDYFALFADRFYRSSYFHFNSSYSVYCNFRALPRRNYLSLQIILPRVRS